MFSWLPGGFKEIWQSVCREYASKYFFFLYSLRMMSGWNQILPPLSLRSIKTIMANPTQIQTTSSVNACCELLTLKFKLSRWVRLQPKHRSSLDFFNLFNRLNCASICLNENCVYTVPYALLLVFISARMCGNVYLDPHCDCD